MTYQPHDALLKASLTAKAARALCRAVLPAEIATSIQSAELSPEPVSFVEDSLKELRSDVCYSAELGGAETLLYVLVEHQSSVDPLMAFRVLRYMVDLWSWWLDRQEEAPSRLPLVIPIVVYHGERAWDAAQAFEALVEFPPTLGEAARGFVPSFHFQLDDLTQCTDEDLRARQAPPFAAVAWIFFRYSRAPDRGIEVWRQCADLLQALCQQAEWKSFLEKLVSYSLIRGLGSEDELRQELRRLGGPEAEEVAVTAGERLLEQGREQGLLDGERMFLRRLLCKRLELSELPKVAEQRIQNATQAQLEAWGERVLDASTLQDVFGE